MITVKISNDSQHYLPQNKSARKFRFVFSFKLGDAHGGMKFFPLKYALMWNSVTFTFAVRETYGKRQVWIARKPVVSKIVSLMSTPVNITRSLTASNSNYSN